MWENPLVQISPCRRWPSLEAIACAGALSEAIGPEVHVQSILSSMFALNCV
jgi:hypothetical protein